MWRGRGILGSEGCGVGSKGSWGPWGGSEGSPGGLIRVPTPPPAPTQQEEGVVLVPRRVLLRLEERVEVPEGALHKVIRGHLREPGRGGSPPLPQDRGGRRPCPPPGAPQHSPHLQEDLAQLRAHLEQRVQVPAGRGQPQRGEVVGFEGQAAPGASAGGGRGQDKPTGGGPGGSGGVTYVAIISGVSSVSGRATAVLKALPLRIQ